MHALSLLTCTYPTGKAKAPKPAGKKDIAKSVLSAIMATFPVVFKAAKNTTSPKAGKTLMPTGLVPSAADMHHFTSGYDIWESQTSQESKLVTTAYRGPDYILTSLTPDSPEVQVVLNEADAKAKAYVAAAYAAHHRTQATVVATGTGSRAALVATSASQRSLLENSFTATGRMT